MGPDRDSGAADVFLAALTELSPLLESESDPDVGSVRRILARGGDVLRSGQWLPRNVRTWCNALDDATLARVVDHLQREIDSWPRWPAAGEGGAGALRARDEAESTIVMITSICLPRGRTPIEVVGLEGCLDALARYDASISIDRGTAEESLGERARLLGGAPWTRVLAEGHDRAADGGGALPAALFVRPPSDAVAQQYVTEGAHRDLVEGFAAGDAAFAADLDRIIDGLATMGEERSLVARVWRSRRGNLESETNHRAFEVERGLFALAAASPGDEDRQVRAIQLGPLPGFPAEASLELGQGRVTLHVFPATAISTVSLGSESTRAPGPDDVWSVSRPLAAGVLSIRVVAADGRHFETPIELVPR